MNKLLILTLILGCLSLNDCEPKNSKTPNNASSTLAAQPTAPQVSSRDERKVRLFLVLLDFSRSYEDYEAVIRDLISELNELGPGDRFVLARIPGELDPKEFILVDAPMAKPANEIFVPSVNLHQWQRKRRDLDISWRRVSEKSKTIAATLKTLQGANTGIRTDLHGAIPYSVRWLNSQSADTITLIICTDLEHDLGSPTFDPPTTPVNVLNLNVRLMFVTYRNNAHWQKIETSWRNYFAGAASFEMLDSGRSVNAMFSPSSIPRTLPSLLAARPAN